MEICVCDERISLGNDNFLKVRTMLLTPECPRPQPNRGAHLEQIRNEPENQPTFHNGKKPIKQQGKVIPLADLSIPVPRQC